MNINPLERQLFVDDEIIKYSNNLQRKYYSPSRIGIVLQPDKPWELNCLILYGSVVKDPFSGNLRMWYSSFSAKRGTGRDVLYAESTDGIHWNKPDVEIFEFGNSRHNNIVIPASHPGHPDCVNVIYDPGERNKNKVYKMTCARRDINNENFGIWTNFSPDGINWSGWKGPVLPGYGDRNTLMYDPELKKPYVIFTRPPDMMKHENFGKRIVVRLDSSDFMKWKQSDIVLKPDLYDPLDIQFYCLVAFRYESMYLGFLQRLHSKEDWMDIELISSRDSILWKRNGYRTAFMEPGFEKSLDCQWIGLSTNPPVEMDGQLFFFYEVRNACHKLPRSSCFPAGVIGAAIMPKDGFASISSGFVPGELITKQFTCPGGKLCLNLNAANHIGFTEAGISAGGTRVEILDQNQWPITGFRLSDCIPLNGDYTGQKVEVEWKNRKNCNILKGEKISLRFWLIHSDLYSFWFEPQGTK